MPKHRLSTWIAAIPQGFGNRWTSAELRGGGLSALAAHDALTRRVAVAELGVDIALLATSMLPGELRIRCVGRVRAHAPRVPFWGGPA